ncbi:hypothetical protein [Hymenobacter fodinae]|uniref:Uncharacterized protein n=1 Tax=Hymenobacter fodinae TaxID=2510796 RepID=A0A4Z0P4E3_9BACT|nr:hypothetical protein [Hymenobacter fodinae]TGE06089.1 hypothetical protein EU556_14575 [Hymenobacter fodinae]
MNKLYLFGAITSGLLVAHPIYSQTTTSESSPALTSVANYRQKYAEGIDINSRLYNGPEYIFYDKYYRNNTGHQFFSKAEEQLGKIEYDGQQFTNIPILYDIHLGQVVLTHPSSTLKFRLVNEKVKSFSLLGHTFVRLTTPTVEKPLITTGFYDLLFNQGLQVYAKWDKEMKTKAEQGVVHAIFTEHVNYFAYKDTAYYRISSINDLANLFPDKKSDIQKFARSNKLKFNKANRAATLVQLAQYAVSTTR